MASLSLEIGGVMQKFVALTIAFLGAACLTIIATTPPRPVHVDAPEEVFSAARAMDDVAIIAAAPHPTGSKANDKVREYLMQRLIGMGLEVRADAAALSPQAASRLNIWRGSAVPAPQLVNIIGVLPGKDRSKPALALMAHYDSVWASPGASDDAAGVAAILEALRALKTGGPPERDVVAIITDAEELGLEGAAHFFATHPLREKIGTIINLEARGGGGRATMFQTAHDNGGAMRVYQDSVSRPATSSLAAFIYQILPNDTDLTPALEGAYTAYNFAFIGRPGLYHSPLITPAQLDQGSLQDMGDQVLGLTKALARADELPGKSADLVFFDVFGWFTIAYAPLLGWVMLAIGGLAYGGAVWGRFDGRASLRGMGRALAIILISAGLLYLGNLVSGADGPVHYYDRLAAIPRLEWMAALTSVAVLIFILRRGGGAVSDWAGFAAPLFLLALAGQIIAPTAAYFIVIPVMLGGLSTFVAARWANMGGQLVCMAAAMIVLGYMGALGHQIMQGVGAGMPMAAALPLALGALVLLPLWPAIRGRSAIIASAALLIFMTGIALWVRLDPTAETAAAFGRFT